MGRETQRPSLARLTQRMRARHHSVSSDKTRRLLSANTSKSKKPSESRQKVVLTQRRTDFAYGYRRRLRPAFALRAVFDSSAFSVPDESNFAVTLSLIHF